MQTVRFSAILLITFSLACGLTPTPAAPAMGETPAPTGVPAAPAAPGEAPATAAGNVYYVCPNGQQRQPGHSAPSPGPPPATAPGSSSRATPSSS
jgi:hypothetical protein